MNNRDALFLSIRPQFAEQIFAGTKTVELRRVRPRIDTGDLVIVYASGSTKALLGAFQVARVVTASPNTIWKEFRNTTGLTREEFDEYFMGRLTAYAIEVAHAWRLPVPVCLPILRKKKNGFRPPQSYHYLDTAAVLMIGGRAILGESNWPASILQKRLKKT